MTTKILNQEIKNLKHKIHIIENEIRTIKKRLFDKDLKFVILKGKEGFADRLQCLLQAIKYALATNRILIIDWRDEDWSHDDNFPLETYFELDGVKNMYLSDFLKLWKDQKNELTVFPIAWKDKIESYSFDTFIDNPIYQLPNQARCIEDISCNKMNDFSENIIVYPGILHRTFDTQYLQCIKISNSIKKRIISFSQKISIQSNKYDIVHLRGGSKKWMGAKYPENNQISEMHNQWSNENEYIEFIWEKYQRNTFSQEKVPLLLISDTYKLISIWQKKYGFGLRIPNCASKNLSGSGIHQLRENHITHNKNISKLEINYECLRDFILMLNSRNLIGDGVSLYSNVALLAKSINMKLVNLI